MKSKKLKNNNSKKAENFKKKANVTKDTTFAELMQKYPETAEILMNKGMHCIGCEMAGFETVEQGAIMHGINPEEIVDEINKKITK